MNDALRAAADVDPQWAKSEHRKQVILGLAVAGAIIAIIGATFAVVVNVKQGRDITRVEHSACATEPAGALCQRVKRESDEAQSIRDTCRSFWKVGYPCPKPGTEEARRLHRRTAKATGAASTPGAGENEDSSRARTVRPPGVDSPKSPPPRKSRPQKPRTTAHPRPQPGPMSTVAPAPPTMTTAPPAASPAADQPEEPGRSNETAAAANRKGVAACVNLAVSACTELGLPELP